MVAHVKRGRRDPGVVERLREQAGGVTELVRGGARALKDQAVEAAGEWTRSVRRGAERLVDERKVRAASTIRRAGGVAHKGADLLRVSKAGVVADYVDLAAATVERASKYLEQADLEEMTEDLGRMVRRNRAVAIGGLLLIGVAMGRLAKVGMEEEEAEERRRARRRAARQRERQ